MQTDFSFQTSQREDSYLASSTHTLDDEEDFIDDNSSTSTAGPPPDSPQSTGRWNLATTQQRNSEPNSFTASLTTRNMNNRTGSFNPTGTHAGAHGPAGHSPHSGSSHANNSSSQNTGMFHFREAHSRTFSGASASVSPTGSNIPPEFGRSFRLFNTSQYASGGSGSRQRDGASLNNTFRSTMLRNMDNNPSARPSTGGDVCRDASGQRSEGSPYLNMGSVSTFQQRQNSLFNPNYGASHNLNGSVCFHSQSLELRNASMVLTGGSTTPFGQPSASFSPSAVTPLLSGGAPLQRGYTFGSDALELAHYAMGGGQLISLNITPMQRVLPTLLSTLRSYLCLNGRTILVGDADHPMEIKRGNLIGTGGFAKVFVGLNTCRGELVAIKEIQVVDVDDVSALREIEQEFALLRSLRHPNIVSYHLFEHSRSQKVCRIVMELLAGDSTFHLLHKFGPLTEAVLRRITRHLLDAITYIHREGISHRDIKPANILVSHKGEVKLCDFGCSKRISELSKASSCVIGTPIYMAPELIKGEATHKADIWSMGCTLFELATGLLPWYHSGVKDNLPLMFYITTTSDSPLVLPSTGDASALEFSSEFLQFMEMCFVRDPQRRPEAVELLKHPWITGARASTPSTAPPSNAAITAGTSYGGIGSLAWSPRVPADFLSLRAESQDAMGAPRPAVMSLMRGSEPTSSHDSVVAISNEDSFVSELAAAKLSTSTAVLVSSPCAAGEDAVETELHCQQELEEVSAATTIDLCHGLMNFPESCVKSLEQRLMAMEGGATTATETETPEGSALITRTFSVPLQSLNSHRGPISISIGDFPSSSVSPEHSILHDNFYYNQAHLGASAGNFVLPSEAVEPPAQQYLRINDEGNLDFATVHEYDSDFLVDTGHAKSTSADSSVVASFSSRLMSPGRNGSFSRVSGSPGMPFIAMSDRRPSPQRSATNSGYFLSPGGESPVKSALSASSAAGGNANRSSVAGRDQDAGFPPTPSSSSGQGGSSAPNVHSTHQQSIIPPPPLLAGLRPSPLTHLQGTSPGLHPSPPPGSLGAEETVSSQTQSPFSVQSGQSASFRQLPEGAKVASDGKLHMSFSVITTPGCAMNVPLDVNVSDVHCKVVDNQPNFFVAFSDDIRGQIATRIKEVAAQAQPSNKTPPRGTSSRTTSPRGGLQQSTGSGSGGTDAAATAHQRAPSTSSGAHFYNSPSYRASRSPARTLSRLSSDSTSHSHHPHRDNSQQEGSLSPAAVNPAPSMATGNAHDLAAEKTPGAGAVHLGGEGELSKQSSSTHSPSLPAATGSRANPPTASILSATGTASPRSPRPLREKGAVKTRSGKGSRPK